MAIPTVYSGSRFRSRLEARWAAFFDLLGWKWEYEPIDLAGYIPDFVLLFDVPLLVEVKPVIVSHPRYLRSNDVASEAMTKIEISGWGGPALLVGACVWENAPGGMLFQSCIGQVWCGVDEMGAEYWDCAQVVDCKRMEGKSSAGLHEETQNWQCKVHDHTTRSGAIPSFPLPIVSMFREAGNRVQWRRADE